MLNKLINLCSAFLALAALAACDAQTPPSGVVATVNGEPIYLHSIETLLDSRSSDYTNSPSLTVEDIQKNYIRAFGALLAHTLVRQELRQRGIDPDSGASSPGVEDYFKEEMGEEELNAFLAESSIRRDDWERLMRDNQALETFRKQALLPGIKIDPDEIRAYYAAHEEEFQLPVHLRACFLSAPEKSSLESMCKSAGFADLPDPLLCADMEAADLPPPWREEAADMRLNACGKIREENGAWQTVVIQRRSKAGSPKLAELYALIERILLEQKEKEAFDKWLAEKAAASSITVAPELNAALALIYGEEAEKPAPGNK